MPLNDLNHIKGKLKKSSQDKKDMRNEERYPCVNVDIQYSSLKNSYLDNLSHSLYQAAVHDMSLSGLAFDVHKKSEINDILLLQFHNSDKTVDQLVSRVKWQKELPGGFFRVGVMIDDSLSKTSSESAVYRTDPVGINTVPDEVEMLCPSCGKKSTLHFVTVQPVLKGHIHMPLYDCAICGTTRTLPGLFPG